jgi:uncharacterized protein YecT (DUF1311 family)
MADVPNGQSAPVPDALPARTGRAVAGNAGAPCAGSLAATRPGYAIPIDDLTDDHMMSPLRVSIALAISASQLVGCDDGVRAEAEASRSRESSLVKDLQLAGDSSLARQVAKRDSHAVVQSSGTLESSGDTAATRTANAPAMRNASNVSTGAVPSAEGYIGPSCASPARDDQQRCLLGYLAKSDLMLDRYYQALILRLKTEAGTKANAAEPPTVQRLRSAQRAWLVYRDDECRKRTRANEGPLWAPVRAKCLAEYSALRARELDDALAKRKALSKGEAITKREKPSKSKRPSARKSTRQRRSRAR